MNLRKQRPDGAVMSVPGARARGWAFLFQHLNKYFIDYALLIISNQHQGTPHLHGHYVTIINLKRLLPHEKNDICTFKYMYLGWKFADKTVVVNILEFVSR